MNVNMPIDIIDSSMAPCKCNELLGQEGWTHSRSPVKPACTTTLPELRTAKATSDYTCVQIFLRCMQSRALSIACWHFLT